MFNLSFCARSSILRSFQIPTVDFNSFANSSFAFNVLISAHNRLIPNRGCGCPAFSNFDAGPNPLVAVLVWGTDWPMVVASSIANTQLSEPACWCCGLALLRCRFSSQKLPVSTHKSRHVFLPQVVLSFVFHTPLCVAQASEFRLVAPAGVVSLRQGGRGLHRIHEGISGYRLSTRGTPERFEGERSITTAVRSCCPAKARSAIMNGHAKRHAMVARTQINEEL